MSAKDIIAFNRKPIVKGKLFTFSLPLKTRKAYEFFASIGDHKPFKLKPFFDFYGKLNHQLDDSYWISDNHIIKFRNEAVAVYDYSKKTHFVSEMRYLKGIANNKDVLGCLTDRAKNILSRLLYYTFGLYLKNKNIWIISDREENATDNSLSFFKYIAKNNLDNNKKVFFVVNKSSANYGEIKECGSVVELGSLRYKMLYLHADKIITSYAYGSVIDSFFELRQIHGGLMNHEYVYLQHGVLQGKPEPWLNILERNIKLFVVSTEMEMEAVRRGSLGYSDDTIKILGMPRFDEFRRHTKKPIVAIIPMRHRDIAGESIDYCNHYNELINNSRLKKILTDNEMEGWFYIDPNYVKQHDDFIGNEIIGVRNIDGDYSKILGEASILITDNSGAQFDFAYQKKPVVYLQFDRTHEGEGVNHNNEPVFFDCRNDGFGPVAKSIDEVVDHIEKIISENSEAEKEYRVCK